MQDAPYANAPSHDWPTLVFMPQERTVSCATHGTGSQTFVCKHLAEKPKQPWHSSQATDADPWPDAWCAECNELFKLQGEWNESNSGELRAVLLCHACYETARAQSIEEQVGPT